MIVGIRGALAAFSLAAAWLGLAGCDERPGDVGPAGDRAFQVDGGAGGDGDAGGDDAKARPPRLAWSRVSAGPYTQYGTAVAIDPAGEVVVLGQAFGQVDLGGGLQGRDNRYSLGFFVARYGVSGGHLWSRHFRVSAGDFKGLAIDAQANALIAGTFARDLDLGGGSLLHAQGDKDGVVVKLGPTGEVLWARQYGGSGHCMPQQVAVDDKGQAVVVGRVRGSVDFGDGAKTTAGWDVFLLRLDQGGGLLWDQVVGDASDQLGHDVSLAPGGEILLSARLAGRLDFTGGSVECNADNCLALVKLDRDGRFLWGKSYANLFEGPVAVDGAGNILVGGALNWPTDFGGGTLIPAGYPDALVVKLDPDGRHLFSQRFGNDWGWQWASDLAADGAGNVWLVGGFSGEVDFGGGVLVSAGDLPFQEHSDAFVAVLDSAGRHLMSGRYGGPDEREAEENATAVAANAAGEGAVVGSFVGSIDFGDGPHVGGGQDHMFVAKWTGR